MDNDSKFILKGTTIFAFIVVAVISLAMWGCPNYNVWSRQMEGEAELAQATFNRQIKVQEAQAHLQAAKSLADAEIERARGVARANEIIGTSLQNNEAYLRYLYIQGLQDKENNIIYVPTEAGLPILEASRFNQKLNTGGSNGK
jgi:regulator of protease activity HflC (stomatin/prohibitin superfamily)